MVKFEIWVEQNADGYLSRIVNPAGESVQLRYAAGGLLTELIDARGINRIFGMVGRAAPYVAIAMVAYDVVSIGSCTNDCMKNGGCGVGSFKGGEGSSEGGGAWWKLIRKMLE